MALQHKNLAKNICLVTITGRFDQSQVAHHENQFLELLTQGRNRLVINLAGVTYINSGGLRCLVSIWRKAQESSGDVVLCGLTDHISDVFSVVGFDKVFSIYPDCDEAIASLKKQ